ncbi:MAG: D-alanyl-D-alanine carboxypeptidase family protein [Lachnospiraceae bacterium]
MPLKRILLCFLLLLLLTQTLYAQEEINELYAQSAVLMDADSGRILVEKNGYEKKAMASTTKIMTCILALEQSKPTDIVTVSKEAVIQPKVHLGMKVQEQFYMKDLLYSLMLESHNDTAVAIAEHIGGTVEGFAKLMNQKAQSIGCKNTYFITPNGLDASNETDSHGTTAADLALIMRYCIQHSPKRMEFLEITQTPVHSFIDCSKTSSYLCNNHNAFLQMMDGAMTGKTGFTGEAGYCYVGALERDGKTFIVSLLACGWPNQKNNKWMDTKTLMEYGIAHYELKNITDFSKKTNDLNPILVLNGQTSQLGESALLKIGIQKEDKAMLLSKNDQIELQYEYPKAIKAPIQKGEKIGQIKYLLNKNEWHSESLIALDTIEQINFTWCFQKVFQLYEMQN